jgi:hypothetical protein
MKFHRIATGIAVVLSVSACTVERVVVPEIETATVPTTEFVPPTTEYRMTQDVEEMLFIDFIVEMYGSLPNSKDELLETGYLVCTNLASGTTLDELSQMIGEASETQDSIDYLAAVTAAAIGFLCPEYMPDDV